MKQIILTLGLALLISLTGTMETSEVSPSPAPAKAPVIQKQAKSTPPPSSLPQSNPFPKIQCAHCNGKLLPQCKLKVQVAGSLVPGGICRVTVKVRTSHPTPLVVKAVAKGEAIVLGGGEQLDSRGKTWHLVQLSVLIQGRGTTRLRLEVKTRAKSWIQGKIWRTIHLNSEAGQAWSDTDGLLSGPLARRTSTAFARNLPRALDAYRGEFSDVPLNLINRANRR